MKIGLFPVFIVASVVGPGAGLSPVQCAWQDDYEGFVNSSPMDCGTVEADEYIAKGHLHPHDDTRVNHEKDGWHLVHYVQNWAKKTFSVRVAGTLVCGEGNPVENEKVFLIEKDLGHDSVTGYHVIDPDDLKASTETGPNGEFDLEATETEYFTEPSFRIVVKHYCGGRAPSDNQRSDPVKAYILDLPRTEIAEGDKDYVVGLQHIDLLNEKSELFNYPLNPVSINRRKGSSLCRRKPNRPACRQIRQRRARICYTRPLLPMCHGKNQ